MNETNYNEKNAHDITVASIVTNALTPFGYTRTEFADGAERTMSRLLAGDWGHLSEKQTVFIKEFIKRVISTAQREGIDITAPEIFET